jgi:hypothetical protein
VLQAGSGGDILIGGTTSYDSSAFANNTALDQILNEWQSGDSYATRIATIRDGVGPGGAYRLAFDSTVADDSAANQLYGGSGMDWFFQGAHDVLYNVRTGEQVDSTGKDSGKGSGAETPPVHGR